jgi:succinyl-diaminopimelate desuccinylase
MTPLEQTLADLVEIHSVTGSEGRIATAIAERLLPVWGMADVQRLGNSLVVGNRTNKPLISLYGHLDTVPEQQGNRSVRIENGNMYGLGTSDMKAGLAVMIHLLEDDRVRNGPYDVVGVFYDREEGPVDENGLEDVLDRAEWLTESEFAVVMEPTDNAVELGCNGVINADVIFRGQAAHSARPWLGENAVTKAGAWLAELDEMEPEPVEIEGLVFHEVFSVTRANGGIANNVLPAEFVVNLNYRFPPIYDLEEAEARLRIVASEADGIVFKDMAPAGAVPDHNPHAERLNAAVPGPPTGKQGWTDVARLTDRGVPAANFGPGVPAQAHQVGEHVPLANLQACFDEMVRFLTS